jgi:hypothetical protein
VITAPMPKIPLDVSIRSKVILLFRIGKTFFSAHWLAIEGKQPRINENPEIISNTDLTAASLNPVRCSSILGFENCLQTALYILGWGILLLLQELNFIFSFFSFLNIFLHLLESSSFTII